MVTLRVYPSRYECLTVFGLYGLAALAVALSAVPLWLAWSLWVALALGACGHWRQAFGSARVLALDLAADHCLVHYADSTVRAALPRPQFVSEWLLVLRIVRGGERRPLLLMLWPGSLSRRDAWRLRRYLHAYPVPPG